MTANTSSPYAITTRSDRLGDEKVRLKPMAKDEDVIDLSLQDRLSQLAALAPRLRDPDATFGHWRGGPAESTDNCITMPWFERGDLAKELSDMLDRSGWLLHGFDWDEWTRTKEGRALLSDPIAIGSEISRTIGEIPDRSGAWRSVLCLMTVCCWPPSNARKRCSASCDCVRDRQRYPAEPSSVASVFASRCRAMTSKLSPVASSTAVLPKIFR